MRTKSLAIWRQKGGRWKTEQNIARSIRNRHWLNEIVSYAKWRKREQKENTQEKHKETTVENDEEKKGKVKEGDMDLDSK